MRLNRCGTNWREWLAPTRGVPFFKVRFGRSRNVFSEDSGNCQFLDLREIASAHSKEFQKMNFPNFPNFITSSRVGHIETQILAVRSKNVTLRFLVRISLIWGLAFWVGRGWNVWYVWKSSVLGMAKINTHHFFAINRSLATKIISRSITARLQAWAAVSTHCISKTQKHIS